MCLRIAVNNTASYCSHNPRTSSRFPISIVRLSRRLMRERTTHSVKDNDNVAPQTFLQHLLLILARYRPRRV